MGTASPQAQRIRQPHEPPLDETTPGITPDSYTLGLQDRLSDPAPTGGSGLLEAPTTTGSPAVLDASQQVATSSGPRAYSSQFTAASATQASGVAQVPLVQTRSGLFVPASAVSPDLFVAQQQQLAASPEQTSQPEHFAAVSPDLFAAQQEQLAASTELKSQAGHFSAVSPDLFAAQQEQLAASTEQRTGTAHLVDIGEGVMPKDATAADTGTAHLVDIGEGVMPKDATAADTGTAHLVDIGEGVMRHQGPLTGLQTAMDTTTTPGTARDPLTGLETATDPATGQETGTDPQTGPSLRTQTELSTTIVPGEATETAPAVVPEQPLGDPLLPGAVQEQPARQDEPTARRRKVPRNVPADAHPVEDNRPLQEGEYPRHVVHEEVVLDAPGPDGTTDRVLVDVGEPRVSTADPTPPPAGEHIAGNQKITVSGQNVYGEDVAPSLPARDAAAANPSGQVEEAVFVTDTDTGETVVHRYREPGEPGESLEEQLERTAEEDRELAPEPQPAQSKYERARTFLQGVRARTGTAAGAAARAGGTALERGQALRAGAEAYVDRHAPETKKALLQRTQQFTGGKPGKAKAAPPKSLDTQLSELISGKMGQPAGQKKSAKSKTARRSSTRKERERQPRGKRQITVYID